MPVDLDQEKAGKAEGFLTQTFELRMTFPGNLLQSAGGTLKEDIWLHFVRTGLYSD